MIIIIYLKPYSCLQKNLWYKITQKYRVEFFYWLNSTIQNIYNIHSLSW